MLSSLPPELLHQIIESTVPHTFHTTTYVDRQRTLCSLSLVSKQLRAIAQPLLYEIVWINTLETFDRYKTSTGDTGEANRHGGEVCNVQTVVIGGGDWDETQRLSQGAMSEDIARFCGSVKSLTRDFGFVKLEIFPFLEEFSDLTSLHLSWISFEPIDVPELPRLRSLTMCGVRLGLMASLLDPAVVPRLKHLSLADDFAESVRQLKLSCIANLLPQLHTLNLALPVWNDPEFAFLHSAADRTLVDVDSLDLNSSRIDIAQLVNVRFLEKIWDGLQNHIDIERDLNQWVSVLQVTPKPSLRRLHLDSSLQTRSTFPYPIAATMDKLMGACRDRSVEVIFDLIPENFRLDPWISAEFIKMQKSRQNEVLSRETVIGRNEQG